MFFTRKLFPLIQKQLRDKRIVVLTGMRRVGKTTLYRQLFDQLSTTNKVFFDLDNPVEQKIFEEMDYNNIWANLQPYGVTSSKPAYIFLDEIQSMPAAILAVKYLHDHYNVHFFLTGSSSFYLKNLFPESLAGRKIIFELFPLDFEEFLIFKQKSRRFSDALSAKDKNKNRIMFEKTNKLYEEYLEFGGFPQVVLASSSKDKKQQLNDILTSYFEKDVKSLAHFREIKAFRDLLLLLLQRVGAKVEIGKLAGEVGITRETVYSYLSFLQATYFIDLVSPYTRNADREVSGAKKVYFCDTGIVNQFSRVEAGRILENAVYRNLKRYGEITYYQRRTGKEIDFILKKYNVALEVKQKGTAYDYQTLKSLAKSLRIKKYYVITQTYNSAVGFIPTTDL